MNSLKVKVGVVLFGVVWLSGLQLSVAHGDGTTVQWKRIEGILAPGNMVGERPGPGGTVVGGVMGNGLQWTTTFGRAHVNLSTGQLRFFVRGLVLGADPRQPSPGLIGTRGGASQVKGTLVCNTRGPADPSVVVDYPMVELDGEGNASFHGTKDLPPACVQEPEDIAFLIRIAEAPGPVVDQWIAFGAVQTIRP